MRVAIVVPTHDNIPAMFAYDLANLVGFTTQHAPGAGIQAIGLQFVTGTYIHQARQTLAEIAVDAGSDYVLWIDSDMRFPKDALLQLLKHQEDVVGINYSTRGIPPNFVAIAGSGLEGGPPVKCPTLPESTGLEKVEALGFGMVLMRSAILGRLPDPKGPEGPWFQFQWRADQQKFVGEDVYFCRLLGHHGVDVYVDHDLSHECAHIGSFEYRVDHAADLWGREDE